MTEVCHQSTVDAALSVDVKCARQISEQFAAPLQKAELTLGLIETVTANLICAFGITSKIFSSSLADFTGGAPTERWKVFDAARLRLHQARQLSQRILRQTKSAFVDATSEVRRRGRTVVW
ncbi:MAG: hypothetical protein M1815_003064 [Lichina confinis]|nr:MAG: hypothetical protein M1815_003064 [Lichina confinis]